MAIESIHHVTKDNWKSLTESKQPVLVDFWAEWCGPCRAIAPTFEKLAEKFGKDFIFAKVNVDEMQELAEEFGIRSIPTLLLIKGGTIAERIVGTRSFDDLARLLEEHLTPAAKN
jgi:thioredoxin